MANWFLQTGVYLISFSLILLAGLALAWWGFWGNRSKGRARCPKCWYDMRGSLPSVICPECGHDGKNERRLYKNRRRWWAIVVAVIVILILILPSGYFLNVMYGWYREQRAMAAIQAVDFSYANTCPTWIHDLLPSKYTRFYDRVIGLPLIGTKVTDQDLVHLKQMSQLERLDLAITSVNDDGLVYLKDLSQLKALDLRRTGVTDAGLEHLGALRNLEELYLSGTEVTDTGLGQLRSLTRLQQLELGDTAVTPEGIGRLKQSLPNLEVHGP